jgi:tight adherence protein B
MSADSLALGLVLVFVGFLGVGVVIVNAIGGRSVRLSVTGMGAGAAVREEGLAGLADGLLDVVGRREWLADQLDRAGLRLTTGAFGLRLLGVMVVAAIAGGVGAGAVGVVLAPVLAVLLTSVWFGRRRSKRREAFADQLSPTLQTMISGLRAGYSLPQSLDAVAENSPEPTSEEFDRVITELRLGRSVGEALRDMASRVENEDFEWVIVAIEINSEIGGDLSEILQTVEETLRERQGLRRQIRTLSAEGKASAITIYALPFVTLGVIALGNPGYLEVFYTEFVGFIMLGLAGFLMLVGGLWLRRIIRLKY